MSGYLYADDILHAIQQADKEKHPAEQAWIDEEQFGLEEVVLDGKFDFNRIAEHLNRRLEEMEDPTR